MHEGTITGADVTNGGKQVDKWVRKSMGPMKTFKPQQENKMYQRERKEILGPYWVA